VELNIENKGLAGLLDGLGGPRRTLNPILWIESIQDFEPNASLLY
jgi:hypothetical protein